MLNTRLLSATAVCFSSITIFAGCETKILPTPLSTCVPGLIQVCHTYRDASGISITECRIVQDPCASHTEPGQPPDGGLEIIPSLTVSEAAQMGDKFGTLDFDSASAPSENIGSYLISPARMAKRFSLSVDSAILVVEALRVLDESGDTSKLLALGFDERDLKNMSQMKLPEDKSIENVSRILNQDKLFTRAMLSMIRVWATWKIQQELHLN